METCSLPVIGAWGLDQLIRIEDSRTSSTECWAGVSGAEVRKSIINVVFWVNNMAACDYCHDEGEGKDSPTCGLGGPQNEVWLSLIWKLIDVNIVPASWQEVADGDRGGRARNIWRCRPTVRTYTDIFLWCMAQFYTIYSTEAESFLDNRDHCGWMCRSINGPVKRQLSNIFFCLFGVNAMKSLDYPDISIIFSFNFSFNYGQRFSPRTFLLAPSSLSSYSTLKPEMVEEADVQDTTKLFEVISVTDSEVSTTEGSWVVSPSDVSTWEIKGYRACSWRKPLQMWGNEKITQL